jgi:aldehyde dehydrogenase (NAD+)
VFVGRAAQEGERWPQSGSEDLARALAVLREGSPEWSQRKPELRRERVRELGQRLEQDELLLSAATGLGLEPEEFAPHRARIVSELERLEPRPAARAGGVALVAPDWRELVRGAALSLGQELLEGRAVLLFSDPLLPWLGERVATAALAAGVPPGAVALLHGPARELLALGIAAQPASVQASGSAERIAPLRRLCHSSAVARVRLRTLRCRACEVDEERLESEVERLIESAFGRGTTFSGQLPGQVARVFCPQRSFSRFSELLLERLEASQAAREPLAALDPGILERVRAARALGLDEGATLVFGDDEDSPDLAPLVFTNVEPRMACARRQEPLPVLCLLRAERARARTHTGGPG